jgi:hypothetical protein
MNELELLLEQVASAHRAIGPDGAVKSAPAWHDLPEDERETAYQITRELRAMEAALDPRGLSTTGKAVLARIQRGR